MPSKKSEPKADLSVSNAAQQHAGNSTDANGKVTSKSQHDSDIGVCTASPDVKKRLAEIVDLFNEFLEKSLLQDNTNDQDKSVGEKFKTATFNFAATGEISAVLQALRQQLINTIRDLHKVVFANAPQNELLEAEQSKEVEPLKAQKTSQLNVAEAAVEAAVEAVVEAAVEEAGPETSIEKSVEVESNSVVKTEPAAKKSKKIDKKEGETPVSKKTKVVQKKASAPNEVPVNAPVENLTEEPSKVEKKPAKKVPKGKK